MPVSFYFDDDNTSSAINQIRLFPSNLNFRKSGWLSFGTFFGASGDGSDLTLTVLTAEGSVEIPTTSDNITGALNANSVRFLLNATTDPDDVISNITTDTVFLIRFARPIPVLLEVPAITIPLGSVSVTVNEASIVVINPDAPVVDIEVTGLTVALTVSVAASVTYELTLSSISIALGSISVATGTPALAQPDVETFVTADLGTISSSIASVNHDISVTGLSVNLTASITVNSSTPRGRP